MLSIDPQPATSARSANAPRVVEMPLFSLRRSGSPTVACIIGNTISIATRPPSGVSPWAPSLFPPRPERDVLVPTNEVGKRFGVGRRTVGRWVKRAQDAAAKEAASALAGADAA